MPPRVPALAQSENKAKFLERLGISSRNEQGKQIYQMMKEEAVAGRARMSENTSCLLPELVNDPNVKPPYSNTQINETAMHAQTLYIYQTARPETRMYYDLGHYQEGDTEENWVIKWLLWHVFRYRDNRNRGRSIASASPADRSLIPPPLASSSFPDATSINNSNFVYPLDTSGTSNHTGNRLSMHQLSYPPQIDVPLPMMMRSTTPTSTASPSTTTTSHRLSTTTTRDQYWDPVRDAQATNNSSRSHSPRPGPPSSGA